MTIEVFEMPLEEEDRLWDIVDSYFEQPSIFTTKPNDNKTSNEV